MTVGSFTADAVALFLPRTCFVKHRQHDKGEPGLFKEEFRCTEMSCLCSKTYCCYDVTSDKLKISSKRSQQTRTGTEQRRTIGRVSESLERKGKRHFEQ